MEHLHNSDILHRDLKSDNALVAALEPLVVKWADFGVSVKLAAASTAYETYGSAGGESVEWIQVVVVNELEVRFSCRRR